MASLKEVLIRLRAGDPELKEITLVDGEINDDKCASLIIELASSKCQNITRVNLSNNNLNNVSIIGIVSNLNSCKTSKLNSLNISGNNVGNLGAKALVKSIISANLKQLTTLNISNINISHINTSNSNIETEMDGMEHLAEYLDSDFARNLTSLNLSQNNIGSPGAKILGDAIKNRKLLKLENLDISRCNIGDSGGEYLASLLLIDSEFSETDLPNLKSFNIAGNDRMHQVVREDLEGDLRIAVELAAKRIPYCKERLELVRTSPPSNITTSGTILTSATAERLAATEIREASHL
jgi:hypothetical protein